MGILKAPVLVESESATPMLGMGGGSYRRVYFEYGDV
jgi:hypothetical protein